MHHTEVLNIIAEQNNIKSYLEIGVRDKSGNFDKINVPHKICVDPDVDAKATYVMTSDEYFERYKLMFDLIFVDGLHYADQAYRDILNALDCLNYGGFVVVHDCLPETELMQELPQRSEEWTGDVWKAFVRLRTERDDLYMFTIPDNYGIGIIQRGKQVKVKISEYPTFDALQRNKKYWLNLIDEKTNLHNKLR